MQSWKKNNTVFILGYYFELRSSYESSANTDDGADFHEFNKGNN